MNKKKTITFGKTLVKLRRSQLLSQEDLAEYSKLDRKTISNLEGDSSNPTLDTVFNLAVALGMKPSELIKEIEDIEENVQYLLKASKEVEASMVLHKKKRLNPKN